MRSAKTLVFRVARFIPVIVGCWLLIVLSRQGLVNALRNTSDLQTTTQYLMTASQISYSALGPCVVALRFVSLRWLTLVWRAWALFFIATITLIPWAWIGPSPLQTLGFGLVAIAAAAPISLLVFCGVQSRK
jgi:hypothetical protein